MRAKAEGEREKAKKATLQGTKTSPNLLKISLTSLLLSYFIHLKYKKEKKGQECNAAHEAISGQLKLNSEDDFQGCKFPK